MKAKKQAKAVSVVIPAERIAQAVTAINTAATAEDTALAALNELDKDFPTMKGTNLATALVNGGAKWAHGTIMMELSRLRALKKAGKWQDGMTSYQAREAHKQLPKASRDKGKAGPKVANGAVSKESGEKLAAKISREAPDTIATGLVDALMASGLDDLEAVLAEARRLIVNAVNDKKKAKAAEAKAKGKK